MAPPGQYTLTNHDSLPPRIRDSMISILKHWDDNDSDHAYLRFLTPDAKLIFGGPKPGRAAIRAARDAMIHPTKGPIVQCTHVLETGYVAPGADAEREIVIKAVVSYELANGRVVRCPVASLGRFVDGVDEAWPQAEYYEVYLDSAELGKAIVDMLQEVQEEGGQGGRG